MKKGIALLMCFVLMLLCFGCSNYTIPSQSASPGINQASPGNNMPGYSPNVSPNVAPNVSPIGSPNVSPGQ